MATSNIPDGKGATPDPHAQQAAEDFKSQQTPSTQTSATEEEPQLVEIIRRARAISGGDDELARQIISAELDRQKQERLLVFQGRQEFGRQVVENSIFYHHSMREYGLQVLKWLFLLNAGAIAVVMTYVGSGLSKATLPTDVQHISAIAQSVWPFALGCIFITIAGACGFFNFTYATLIHPNANDIYNFSITDTPHWPKPRGLKKQETVEQISKRLSRAMSVTRYIAIALTTIAGGFFVLGVINVASKI